MPLTLPAIELGTRPAAARRAEAARRTEAALTVLLVIGGLAALLVGAEILVRCGTGLARRIGVPPMVIGPTVVSIGTSLPELTVRRGPHAGVARTADSVPRLVPELVIGVVAILFGAELRPRGPSVLRA